MNAHEVPEKGMRSNKLGRSDVARASIGAWSAPTVLLEEAAPLASENRGSGASIVLCRRPGR
jgi:hypothetical protein